MAVMLSRAEIHAMEYEIKPVDCTDVFEFSTCKNANHTHFEDMDAIEIKGPLHLVEIYNEQIKMMTGFREVQRICFQVYHLWIKE